jgi:hypothetical protein
LPRAAALVGAAAGIAAQHANEIEEAATAAEAEAMAAEGEVVTLWRAVELPELKDILRFRDYNIDFNSTFKRFFDSEALVRRYIAANPNTQYFLTYIRLPVQYLSQMEQHPDFGIGTAFGIDVWLQPEFYSWTLGGVQVVP